MYKTNFHYKSDQPFKYSIGGGSKVADSAPSAAALLKCRQLALAEKVFALKGLLLCFATQGENELHCLTILFAGRLRECVFVDMLVQLLDLGAVEENL